LRTLHTDLVGQLYREFDVENCEETVRPTLLKWMDDKGLITRQVERKAVAEAGG
jgi:hypothetical protein